MGDKEGKLVVTADNYSLNSLGKWLMTNAEGLCKKCCGTPVSCNLYVCGCSIDGVNGYTVHGLPNKRSYAGYCVDCDFEAKTFNEFNTESKASFTQETFECNANGTVDFEYAIYYYDNDDPTKILSIEWSRRNYNAWPLYKLTPTFDHATSNMTVEIAWHNSPGDLRLFFSTRAVTVSYTGSGTPSYVNTANSHQVNITDTDGGGSATYVANIPDRNERATITFYTSDSDGGWGPQKFIQSVWKLIRSFALYASDTATITFGQSDECLMCSNSEIIDVEFDCEDCDPKFQLMATPNVRPIYWCGCSPHESLMRGLAFTNEFVDAYWTDANWDLASYPREPVLQEPRLSAPPGQPLTTELFGRPSATRDWQGNLVNWQEHQKMDFIANGISFSLARSPRGWKRHPVYNGDVSDRHWVVNDRPLHNQWNFERPGPNGDPQLEKRWTINTPNNFPTDNNRHVRALKQTATATLEFIAASPKIWDASGNWVHSSYRDYQNWEINLGGWVMHWEATLGFADADHVPTDDSSLTSNAGIGFYLFDQLGPDWYKIPITIGYEVDTPINQGERVWTFFLNGAIWITGTFEEIRAQGWRYFSGFTPAEPCGGAMVYWKNYGFWRHDEGFGGETGGGINMPDFDTPPELLNKWEEAFRLTNVSVKVEFV